MDLEQFTEPQRVKKWGEQTFTIAAPSKIKIQLTGPDNQIILDEGPPAGEVWKLLVRVEATVQ